MNYELRPEIKIFNQNINTISWNNVFNEIKNKKIIIIETYPGTRLEKLKNDIINKINPDEIIWSEDFALQGNDFRQAILPELTEDRVFGIFSRKEYINYFNQEKILKLQEKIENLKNKTIVIYGTGAIYLTKHYDYLMYVDVTRWELQLRYRKKERVFFGDTLENETIKNFKRGYFVEWRMADLIKKQIINKINLYIDGTNDKLWNCIDKNTFFTILKSAGNRPFRLVPYFDYGVWGGQWIEKTLGLGKNEYSRWAWGFDGVPEENSLLFNINNKLLEMPAINLVFFESINLLGEKVWNRFGSEFPIRFDMLDTIKGQNLSLQVHPNVQYIHDTFNAFYTQEESYYLLDVEKDSNPTCYLGFKNNVNSNEFLNALQEAQKTNKLDVEKYVNRFPVKKHDHLLHPAGTIHSSASGCMVLEISSTPYIFTFKLWDWARLDLNGLPRPINIEHGKNVLNFSMNTQRCKNELVNAFKTLRDEPTLKEEHTGLHLRQFIETRRFTLKTDEPIIIECHDSVNMLNLVEGQEILVESIDNSFQSLTVHYAETFIVPESCKQYKIRTIKPALNGSKPMVLQAYVR